MAQQPPSVPSEKIRLACLVILTAVAIGAVLHVLRSVLIPFVLALFFAVLLGPAVEFLVRRARFPRIAAIVAALLPGLAALFLMGAVVSASIRQFTGKIDTYAAQVQQVAERVSGVIGLDTDAVTRILDRKAIANSVLGTLDSVGTVVSQGVLVLVFLGFLLAGSRPVHGIGWEIESKVKRYVVVKFFVSALTGVLVGGIYLLLGIDLAVAFGLLAFLLNFIPNLGSLVAVLLPLPVILLSPDITTQTTVLAIALPIAVNFTIGNVLEPKLLGKVMDLHPVAVLLALILWGFLWGVVGMFLAVPMTVCVRLLLERMEITAPLARMLAGRADAPAEA